MNCIVEGGENLVTNSWIAWLGVGDLDGKLLDGDSVLQVVRVVAKSRHVRVDARTVVAILIGWQVPTKMVVCQYAIVKSRQVDGQDNDMGYASVPNVRAFSAQVRHWTWTSPSLFHSQLRGQFCCCPKGCLQQQDDGVSVAFQQR
eukprot:Gb_33084 [translate_table: standard]